MLYHGSPVSGLRMIEPSVTAYFGKPKQVCLTSLLPMALFYGTRHFEYAYGFTSSGKIYYEEYFPDALRTIYSGKCASLYYCAENSAFTRTAIPNEYVSGEAVPVLKEQQIPDLLEALLEQERQGTLQIIRYAEQKPEMREWVVNAERDVIIEHGLLNMNTPFARYMRETYPASWKLAAQGGSKL